MAAWVSRVDETAVRNTRDVDILLRREDLPAATDAMEAAGFLYRDVANLDIFLDRPYATRSTFTLRERRYERTSCFLTPK